MAEYIEREAAEKILYDGCHTMNGNEGPDDVVEMWHMVQAIPSADVQPVRHGRWNVYSAKHGLYSCSECHCVPAFLHSPYCPNCGARMDAEAKE